MRKILNRVIGIFLRGIIFVVPLVAVFLTGQYLYNLIDSYRVLDNTWITLGILLGGVFVIGVASQALLFRPLFMVFEEILVRTPFFKFVYTSIKDLTKAFIGDQRRFSKPVLVAEGGLQRFGFVTTESLDALGEGFEGKVTVYAPFSYSLSGNLFVVDAAAITDLPDVDPAELMKFIVAGGVTDLTEVGRKDRRG